MDIVDRLYDDWAKLVLVECYVMKMAAGIEREVQLGFSEVEEDGKRASCGLGWLYP